MNPDVLLELERRGWQALSTDGEVAATFYDEVLARNVLFLLPGGAVIDERPQVIESMRGVAWDAFDLSDERVFELTPDCAVVAYRAAARRGGADYEATVNSTYVQRKGSWKLALHQQTPA